MATLSSDIMKELECPVCCFYLIPPINQCSNGHCVCNSCISKVDRCPVCRKDTSRTRNLVLEKVMSGLKYACRNKAEGCPEMLSLDMVKEHDDVCPLGIHECPANMISEGTCTWIGRWDEFEKHVHCIHKIKFNKSPFESSSTENSWEFISTGGKLFLFDKRSENNGIVWKFAVMLIGTRAEAGRYKSVFTLSAKNGVDSNVVTRGVWSFIEQLDSIHSSPKCFSLSTSAMGNFISDGVMNLKVEVIEINNYRDL